MLIIGRSARSEALESRLNALAGFDRWKSVTCDGSQRQWSLEVEAALDEAASDPGALAAIVDAGGVPLPAVLPVVELLRSRRDCEVYVLSELLWPLRTTPILGELFEAPVVRVRRGIPNGLERRAKRAVDFVLSSLGLAALAVPMGLIALAIKLDSAGPLLYKQERIGLRGHRFCVFKFRSMDTGVKPDRHRAYVQALIAGDSQACDLGDADGHDRVYKLTDDARITRVGRVLRRYSLDELPQLWNVLHGDMSLVGPRPPLPYEVDVYTEWHRQRLHALPGISGLWQVGGRSRVTFDEMVFQDLFYATDQSLLSDLAICLRTVPAVINGRGAV